jgi:exoribonuclease-2
MESGNVVEFIDNQKISCAVVIDIKNLRLRLLTENNREVKMSAGRLSHLSNFRLDPSSSRDKLVTRLKEISARRRDLSSQIDLQALWEVLNSEAELVDLNTMTALCFPDCTDADHSAAVVRAFFNDRLYFKFSPEGFSPNSAEKVAQLITQRQNAERLERIVEQGGLWVHKTLQGRNTPPPPERTEIIDILTSYFLFEKDSPHREAARGILKKAGVGTPATIFSFLVKIGVWDVHENIELLRSKIPTEFAEDVMTQARILCEYPPAIAEDRRDLRTLPAMTVDGPGTLDYDDAVSITFEEGVFKVGIHIADVASLVDRNSAIDQDAMARASSIYMPDRKIPMLPACLSEDVCSLKVGQDRPAISTLITTTADAEILDFEIVPSVIRVARQLTYQDVDAMAAVEADFKALLAIAKNYRRRRLDNGALMIDLPEIAIWLTPEAEPVMARIDRESPGRMLVSELMIMGNELAARHLAEHKMPAIFRSQASPRERLVERDEGTLFQNWMQRRQINRFVLNSTPQPHAGLGVPAYVTVSSPIRKYTDLITQRQLRATLGMKPAYSREEMDFLIAGLQETMGLVGRIQFQRHRYWLLRYLEGLAGQKKEGIVLNKRRDGYAVLLPDYMLECHLSGAENIKLKPEDLVQVTLQHINARNDVITVYLG